MQTSTRGRSTPSAPRAHTCDASMAPSATAILSYSWPALAGAKSDARGGDNERSEDGGRVSAATDPSAGLHCRNVIARYFLS